MTKSTTLLLVLTGAVAGTALGSGLLILSRPASARQAEPPVAAAGATKTATATVESVDKANRMVTLKSEQGKTMTVNVPEDVQAFDRLKKGDKIRMAYQEAMAVALIRPGEARPTDQVRETTERTQGAQPSGMIERTRTVSAEIVSVDTKKNMVKFKGPQGKVQEVVVQDPAVRERLKQLKPGEVVEVVYTEALAMTLDPAK
jgi:hypothetical protein